MPVDEAGVAEVSLKGDVPRPSHQSLELALVQLAWTLRQDPSVRAIRLTVNGQPASIRGGDTPFDVDTGTEYDPTGAQASAQLYGLRGNRLLVGSAEAMTPVRTPLGRAAPLSRIGVNLDGTRLAAVTADHRSALTAAIAGPGNRLSEIGTATGRFLTPGWDFDDRLWLLDTGLGQARVTMVHAGTSQPLQVPGVSGRKVVDFTVSRDGSRIVAVVRHGNTDRVVVSRVAHDEKGRVVKALPGQIVYASRGSRIRDVGWETATTLAVLTPLTNRLAQVREIPIDGSLGDPAEATLTLSGSPRKLVTSPVENEVSYAVVSGGLLDLADALSPAAPVAARPMTVTYVG